MFKRTLQLRQEGLRSFITSSISLIAYSIAHFLTSSIPYSFPTILCLLLINCKESFIPSDAFLWLHFHQETRTAGRKEGEVRRSDKAEKGGMTAWSRLGSDWTRLKWTEIDLNNETSSLTLTANEWMTATDCAFNPAVAWAAKLKDLFFPQWGVTLYNVSKKVTETLINSQSIAGPQQKHSAASRLHARPVWLLEPSTWGTEGEKWRKKIDRNRQAEVEDEKEGQQERNRTGQGERMKRNKNARTDGFWNAHPMGAHLLLSRK